MRLAVVALAIAAAILHPAVDDWQLALPAGSGAWVAPLQRLLSAPIQPAVPADSLGADDRHTEVCECDCGPSPVAHLATTEAVLLVAAGCALWPLLDVLQLAKRAWQRRVAAAERVLQVRPPDRP
jgi:hypothetical protein